MQSTNFWPPDLPPNAAIDALLTNSASLTNRPHTQFSSRTDSDPLYLSSSLCFPLYTFKTHIRAVQSRLDNSHCFLALLWFSSWAVSHCKLGTSAPQLVRYISQNMTEVCVQGYVDVGARFLHVGQYYFSLPTLQLLCHCIVFRVAKGTLLVKEKTYI